LIGNWCIRLPLILFPYTGPGVTMRATRERLRPKAISDVRWRLEVRFLFQFIRKLGGKTSNALFHCLFIHEIVVPFAAVG